jgi:hypothetical protein
LSQSAASRMVVGDLMDIAQSLDDLIAQELRRNL